MKTLAMQPQLTTEEPPAGGLPGVSDKGFVAFGLAIAAATAFVVLIASNPNTRITAIALTLMALTLTCYLGALARSAPPATLRLAPNGPLRLVPPPQVDLLLVATYALGLTPGVIALASRIFGDDPMSGQGAVWITVISAASALGLIRSFATQRIPLGLFIDTTCVSGTRGSGHFEILWKDVARVEARRHGKVAHIVIESHDGRSVAVKATRIGSDPVTVKAILSYYLDHPEERYRLNDGVMAVRHVEAVAP